MDGPCHVYRLFDYQDQLLYIGCSRLPAARKFSHADKHWYHEIATMTSVVFPDLRTARSAEAAAIEHEHPRHNEFHNIEKQRAARIICRSCGGPKEYKFRESYCPACKKQRLQEWRALNYHRVPKPRRLPSLLCKCGQPKNMSKKSGKIDHAYCLKCKQAAAARHRNRSHDVTIS